MENSAAYLLDRLRPDADMLDVGCGPGTITIGFAERLSDGSVIGLDSDAGIVEQARALPAAKSRSNLFFEVGDVYELPFDNGRFDVIHAHQVLQHLSDPIAALMEMRRVCRPGGTVAFRDADYGAMFWYPASEALAEWQALYRAVAASAGGEPDAGRHLGSWAHAGGFSQIEVSASMWCFATPEERAWWGGLWAQRVAESRFAEQAIGAKLATAGDLERLAEGWRSWSAEPDGCFFIPHGEVLCVR